MIQHKAYCPHCNQETNHVNNECIECKKTNEEKRWESLTLEEKVDELKGRVDEIERFQQRNVILGKG